jgi:hypothetical protein
MNASEPYHQQISTVMKYKNNPTLAQIEYFVCGRQYVAFHHAELLGEMRSLILPTREGNKIGRSKGLARS